jgi:peptide/nickel transport system permease protein
MTQTIPEPGPPTPSELALAEGSAERRAKRKGRLGLSPALPLFVLAAFILLAIFAPVVTKFDPTQNDLVNSLIPPAWVHGGSTEHLLGTDSFGRDVFTRLVYGARVSLGVASLAILIAVVVGTTVGIVAGFLGGWVDSVLMRLTDVILSLPNMVVALVLAIAVGPSFRNLVLVLGFMNWPRIARLIRGETLLLKKMDFVRYAEAIGVSGIAAMSRHILHNILPTLLVATTLEIGSVILTEAAISFLGAGVPPPSASWGVMIADGESLVSTGWWISLVPGVAIALVVLSSNAFGDWLRDRLDPKSRRG